MSLGRLHHSLLRIRRVEEALAARYAEQEMRCPMHLCIGQEAIAVGVCAAMQADDWVFSNHRAHGHYLAKGGALEAMIAELYGKATGCCGGRGGSMHLIDRAAGFMGSTPIVGGTVPIAVGAAWASRLQQTGRVVTVFFGDGCFEEGVLHESMNFAALHRLPIVFVCENNDYSVYTRLEQRQPPRPIHAIAAAHGLHTAAGDGNDVEAVLESARRAVAETRAGGGPWFLEFNTYRWREHCGPDFDDALNYRSADEIDAGLARCPLAAFQNRLASAVADAATMIDHHEHEIAAEIDAAFAHALASDGPATSAAAGHLYA